MPQSIEWWWFAYPAITIGALIVIALVARSRPGFGRRTALAIAMGAYAIYIVWRVLFTIPTATIASLIVGITLLVVEVIVFTQSVMFAVLSWRPQQDDHVPLSALTTLPRVDVLIATYNEPAGVLRMTVAAATAMRYPGDVTVYVCDDGNSAHARDIAREFGAVHLAREDHSHAKAGNLNHALGVTHGELVMVLDADMVPRREFLERVVGRFVDPRLGFVQTPQAFYNQDPFQYNLFAVGSLPNEQDFFMRTLQGAKARFNGTMFVGSNAIFRRSALEAIGGFAVGVITEDMATGMLMQAAQFRGEFVPEVLAAGLAAESFGDLIVQRDRWARGNIQAARLWNPLTLPGLTPMQRWIYLDGLVYWFFGVFKLLFVVIPLLYLILGVPALQTTVVALAVFWLPFFITSAVSFAVVSGGRRSVLWSHVYELAMAPSLAVSVLRESLGLRKGEFAVTPKGVASGRASLTWRLVLPPLVFIALSVYGLLAVFVFHTTAVSPDSLAISVFWVVYNMAGLVLAALLCVERPRYRRAERITSGEAVSVEFARVGTCAAILEDLSMTGARVLVPWNDSLRPESLLGADPQLVAVELPEVGRLAGSVRWITSGDDGLTVGFEFAELEPSRFASLVHVLGSSPNWVRGDRERRALLVPTAARAMVRMARGTRRAMRSSPRIPVAFEGEVVVLGRTVPDGSSAGERGRSHGAHRGVDRDRAAPFAAQIHDLGESGCRVASTHRLVPGDVVAVTIPEVHLALQSAEVRWAKRSHGQWHAGLLFTGSSHAETP